MNDPLQYFWLYESNRMESIGWERKIESIGDWTNLEDQRWTNQLDGLIRPMVWLDQKKMEIWRHQIGSIDIKRVDHPRPICGEIATIAQLQIVISWSDDAVANYYLVTGDWTNWLYVLIVWIDWTNQSDKLIGLITRQEYPWEASQTLIESFGQVMVLVAIYGKYHGISIDRMKALLDASLTMRGEDGEHTQQRTCREDHVHAKHLCKQSTTTNRLNEVQGTGFRGLGYNKGPERVLPSTASQLWCGKQPADQTSIY